MNVFILVVGLGNLFFSESMNLKEDNVPGGYRYVFLLKKNSFLDGFLCKTNLKGLRIE